MGNYQTPKLSRVNDNNLAPRGVKKEQEDG